MFFVFLSPPISPSALISLKVCKDGVRGCDVSTWFTIGGSHLSFKEFRRILVWSSHTKSRSTFLMKAVCLFVSLSVPIIFVCRFHLDTIATKMRTSTPGQPKPPASTDSMDKGLASSSLHAMNPGVESNKTTKSQGPLSGGQLATGDCKEGAGGCIKVQNAQDASAVAARRRSNLEAKKFDKCPVCAQVHMYE